MGAGYLTKKSVGHSIYAFTLVWLVVNGVAEVTS
jgi:hypothetical protein